MAATGEVTRRTIRETNALIRALVEQETIGYPFWMGGIVTKYFVSDSGHIYFDLTDEDTSINCMIRESVRGTLDFPLSNNLDIEVFGTIRFYEKTAKVNIEVEKALLKTGSKPAVEGSVFQQLEQKGLNPRNRRPFPTIIKRIGIVTSKQSQALHDFEDTYRREYGRATTQLVDVRLQGQQAPKEIAEAIQRLNREKRVDVIALIRGGGRATELAVFDDLLIAEAICRSTIPIVTGIGHQRDDTVADQLADRPTITPTAAASALAKWSAPREDEQPVHSWTIYLALALILLAGAVVFAAMILRQSA